MEKREVNIEGKKKVKPVKKKQQKPTSKKVVRIDREKQEFNDTFSVLK